MAETQEPIVAEPEVVVDEYNDGNADSAYDSEVASYTTSLATSVTAYKFENGRRYHAYKEGSYVLPNDEKESDRLDICHKMYEVAMSGKLHFSPISNPKRILDIGTGTGIWAIEMGDVHPQADILGNDLSPIQPRWVPPNVRFEVDDVEAPWTYSQKFDFIFCRTMANTIKDWPRLLQQCLENTKPGGYCEFIDFDIKWTSLDGTLDEESPVWKISREFIKLCAENGMEASLGPHLESLVKNAGFANVVATRVPLPVGTWPADKRLKEVGAWNYLQVTEGLEGFITYLFVRQGWTKEEVDILCAKARQQIKNPKVHCLFYLHIVYGQAPEKKGKGVDDE